LRSSVELARLPEPQLKAKLTSAANWPSSSGTLARRSTSRAKLTSSPRSSISACSMVMPPGYSARAMPLFCGPRRNTPW